MVGATSEPILRERTDIDDYRRFLQAPAELIVRLAADGSPAALKVAAPDFVTKAAKRR
jgi:hypothetical protein